MLLTNNSSRTKARKISGQGYANLTMMVELLNSVTIRIFFGNLIT